MAKLTIREDDKSTVYEILDDVVSIGRKEGASVRLRDSHVGSEHCQIRHVPGVGHKLIDLESRNGTKVNGQYVNQHVLADGDEIALGDVRITFAGAAPTPAVARPAAALPAAAAPARPAKPARPTPMGMSPRDREFRPRSPRAGANTPIIVLGVVVGLLLFGVAAVVFVGPLFDVSKNQGIYAEMRDLRDVERYEQALELAKQADAADDLGYHAKIRTLAAEIEAEMRGRDLNRAGDKAFREFSSIETWVAKHREDTRGAAAKWEAYVEKWKGTFWGGQAQQRLDELMGRGVAGGGTGGGTTSGLATSGQAKIDRAFRLALSSAGVFEKRDEFGPARDVIEDFWDKNQLLADDPEAWRARKERAVRAIEERAQERWEEIDAKAKDFVDAGEYDRAFNLYKEVRKVFGLEKYQTLAKLAMQKLTDDGK
ncbi:MAG: FHA domain-containing protein [Planctomycetota bacterium]